MIRQELLALDEPAHAPGAAAPARAGGASCQDRDAAENGRPEGGHFHDSKPEAQSLRRNTSLSSDEADAS